MEKKNQRFPSPKYTFIWDVAIVVKYLDSLGHNDSLNDKLLTLKLTMLLALTSSARAHEICLLNNSLLVKHHSGYEFHFSNPTKVDRVGKKRPPIKFMPFKGDKNLCVCNCIDSYLLRTKDRRGENSQLLLSYVKPFLPVKTSTVSRWLTNVLSLSGINISVYAGHSTRSASTSKAKLGGVPVKEIMKRGHWASSTTFEKYYFKEVNEGGDLFQSSILAKK